MEYNGKVPPISSMYLNSLSVMIIQGIKDGGIVNEFLDIDTEITYKQFEGDAIKGFVKSYISMLSIDNVLVDVPLNSEVIRKSDGFKGRTIQTDENNIDILYDAGDIQDHTSITNFDGFENRKETDITIQGQMSINIIPQRGVIDGLSFVINSNTIIPVEAGETLPRIDLVMIRKDQLNRTVEIIIRKGNANSKPTTPTFEQTPKGIYELPIYSVYVDINQTVLSRNNVTDMRNPTSKEDVVRHEDLAVLETSLDNSLAEMDATIEQFIDSTKGIYTGIIQAFAGHIAKIPKDAFLCDGREMSRITYARLFAAIGTTWGAGNNDTTFNIPDGRGGVLKGAGQSTKYSYNENRGLVGTHQNTAIRNITGGYDAKWDGGLAGIFDMSRRGAFVRGAFRNICNASYGRDAWGVSFDSSQVVPTGDTNRDNNLAVNFIIFI